VRTHARRAALAPALLPALCLVLLGSAAQTSAPESSTIAEPAVAVSSLAREKTKPARQVTAREVPVVKAKLTAASDERRTRPIRVRVDGVDIDLPVVPVGVNPDGSMEMATSVREVGWYRFGARPVDRTGTTVLAGHVDTKREGLGPLARLRSVDRGSRVVITSADGRTRAYRVVDVRRIAKTRVPLAEVFRRDGQERVVLITCGGRYDRDTGYRDNVLVTAEPMS
jgi:LPXTG-site transpeptidase (sortase) family protein